MACWLVMVPGERYRTERWYLHETLELAAEPVRALAAGDRTVLVAAGTEPVVFGLGVVVGGTGDDTSDPDDPDAAGSGDDLLAIRYTHRLLDTPVPLADTELVDLAPAGSVPVPLPPETYQAVLARVERATAVLPARPWLVSLDLPIEASSPAEAVRSFWTYVTQLGPAELPVFVAPADDELAMQAYVQGELTELDPEEDE